MRRREFITLLSGAAAAWPLGARSQQGDRARRIGVLMGWAETDPGAHARLKVFHRELQDLGWTQGGNLRIEYRWGAGDIARIGEFAKELVALQPDLIVANTTPVTRAPLRLVC
jgi:putative ABC transport system substrate-binding protein